MGFQDEISAVMTHTHRQQNKLKTSPAEALAPGENPCADCWMNDDDVLETYSNDKGNFH